MQAFLCYSVEVTYEFLYYQPSPTMSQCCYKLLSVQLFFLMGKENWILVLVCKDCCNKEPQTGWFKQQKFIVSQFWRLGVSDQGVERWVSSEGCDGKFYSRPLSLVWRWPSHWVFTLSSLCACLCTIFPFSQEHQSYWTRSHFNDFILTWLPL